MDNEVNNNLIFIGGSGRSGTNILRNLLSKHSQVGSLPFEYRFIILIVDQSLVESMDNDLASGLMTATISDSSAMAIVDE